MCERTFYNELKSRKEKGESLDLNKITREEMRILWCDESNTDNILANLFDVYKSEIKKKRDELNINRFTSTFEELETNRRTIHKQLKEKPNNIVLTPTVKKIIAEIDGLSDEDNKSFIEYLIQKDIMLNNIYDESLRYKALINVPKLPDDDEK